MEAYFIVVWDSAPAATESELNGYSNFNTLVSMCPSGAWIFKHGVLFRSGTNAINIDIATCQIPNTLVGTIQYFKVTSETGFFSYTSDCSTFLN